LSGKYVLGKDAPGVNVITQQTLPNFLKESPGQDVLTSALREEINKTQPSRMPKEDLIYLLSMMGQNKKRWEEAG
jgi:hypothetical protein